VNGWLDAASLLESEWARVGGLLTGFVTALRFGPRFGRWLAGLATANYRLALKSQDCEALTLSLARSLAELDRERAEIDRLRAENDRLRAAPTSSRTGRAPRGLSD
jgi:ABC-type transporter Mla subunit MlaD